MDLKFDIIIYHSPCPDGFTSAWAFWQKFGDQCEYLPFRYGQPPPDVTGKSVAIVDFSFKRPVLQEMAASAERIVVLDHHRSAQRDLQDLDLGGESEIIFDMERSGAQIAWDYLHPNESRPWFVDYVADRDLWRHTLPKTKEISQTLFFDGYFTDFNKLQELYLPPNPLNDTAMCMCRAKLAERGKVLLEYKTKDCEQYAAAAKPTVMVIPDGRKYRVDLVCCPRVYRSEVGNIIASTHDCDFAAMYWYDFFSEEWWLSFRASKDSTIDLSEITSHLPQGGGHPKAAGFTIYGKDGEDLHTYFKVNQN